MIKKSFDLQLRSHEIRPPDPESVEVCSYTFIKLDKTSKPQLVIGIFVM